MTTTPPRPRLQDVADLAGVSMKTVSNVINDFVHVRPATRERVQRAIAELGYRPNLSARNLARGRTGVIALALPQVDLPYFAALTHELVEEARRTGWVVLIEQTFGHREAEERVLAATFPQRIDGIIFSPVVVGAQRIAHRPEGTPMVLLGEHIRTLVTDHVVLNNAAASRAATEHLLGLGRRRIAFIGPQPLSRYARFDGYRQALQQEGIELDLRLTRRPRSNTGAEGEAAMADLLGSGTRPDAVFCATDWLALGALRALQLRGLHIPDDVAVMGFDDIPYGQVAVPSLSSVRPDRRQIARMALDALDRQLTAEEPAPPVRSLADFTLVPRESTLGR